MDPREAQEAGQTSAALGRATGLTDENMHRWHVEFERMTPEGHRDFLESLGIPPDEIDKIRRWARGAIDPTA